MNGVQECVLVLTTVAFVSQGGEERTELYIHLERQLFSFMELYIYLW